MGRVVITGVGGISALGSSWPDIRACLRAGRNAVRYMTEWDSLTDLNTRLAAPIDGFKPPAHWTRKQLRSMGRVSQFAVRASELALADAGFAGDPSIKDGRMGVACGSSVGSTPDIRNFVEMLQTGKSGGLNANSYVRMMPHTAAANVGIFFGLTGRIIPTSSACTSGSQGIGYACEAIRSGRQTLMLAGGAEELCPSEAIAFDILYATSRRNDSPAQTPRPYDKDRDGLVVGEGAAMFVLEDRDHALTRGARIHAEVVGADHRLRQRPRNRHRTRGHCRDPRHVIAARQSHAHQHPEKLPWTYTRRLRSARGLVHDRNDERRLVRAHDQP
ncbi:MAG: beta-ketoacyl synthase, C-terminal domain protein 1 [Steroidobacteraceae bacterium]|nr:beta-ketoacyl synthase, C-terminal domain protein 1 [Steroidobacteraceae bacterium]